VKTRIYISFNEGRANYVMVRDLLRAIGCGEKGLSGQESLLCGLFGRMFYANDPKLDRLRTALREACIQWSERVEHIYSYEELLKFPLLKLGVDRYPILSGGPENGTEYDTSGACPRCGTGAVQTSAMMVAFKRKTGQLCATARGHILVSSELADAFRAEVITGVELRQVRYHRNNEPLPWWQIISTYEMPKFGPETKHMGRDTDPGWGCPVCQRDMHVNISKEPTEIVYDRREVDPDQLPDVVHTWECFGRSVIKDDPVRHLIQGFAEPLTLVKPRIMVLMRKLKVRRATFSPIWVR